MGAQCTPQLLTWCCSPCVYTGGAGLGLSSAGDGEANKEGSGGTRTQRHQLYTRTHAQANCAREANCDEQLAEKRTPPDNQAKPGEAIELPWLRGIGLALWLVRVSTLRHF